MEYLTLKLSPVFPSKAKHLRSQSAVWSGPAQNKPRRCTSPQSQAAEKLSSSEPNLRVQLRYGPGRCGRQWATQRGCHSSAFPRYSAVKLYIAQIRDDI